MQLIHGDCLEKMKDIPDKNIDMIDALPNKQQSFIADNLQGGEQ